MNAEILPAPQNLRLAVEVSLDERLDLLGAIGEDADFDAASSHEPEETWFWHVDCSKVGEAAIVRRILTSVSQLFDCALFSVVNAIEEKERKVTYSKWSRILSGSTIES